MRTLMMAAAVSLTAGGAAQAVVYDLDYTVEAEITSVEDSGRQNADAIEQYGYTFTREVGDIETFGFQVEVDTTARNPGEDAVRGPDGWGHYYNLDLTDGSGSFGYGNADEWFAYTLLPDGTGSLSATIASAPEIDPYLIWETVEYDVLSWSVEGLPEMAPVPLPASAPLLLAGLGAAGWVARRRKDKR